MALQYASAIVPQSVLAAPVFNFVPDDQGANDEPGQKDLTAQATAFDGSVFYSAWKWDDTSWSGDNTGDACSLFDTDGDGKVNYSVCVTIATEAAVETSTRVYSCGDDKVDRCTNPIALLGTEATDSTAIWCSVASASGQFPGGGTDTQATCNISQIADDLDVAALNVATLINTCSYPSQEPNSDPSDCVLTPTNVTTATSTQVMNTNGTAADEEIADGATVSIGTVAYDTADITGNTATAGGTVTYYVEEGDSSCTIDGATSLGEKTVTNGNVPNSNTYTFASAGTYQFWAVYSGATNNRASTSPCLTETVIVDKASPAVITVASATVAVGNAISDTATISGLLNPSGTGSITFNLYAPGDTTCTGTVIFTSTVTVTTNGSYPSGSFTTSAAGTYRWIANYSGDDNNDATANACNATNESVPVSPRSPTIATVATVGGAPGDPITDTAALTGAFLPTTGNVTFNLYGTTDATCVGTAIFTSTVAINANGTATSAPFTVTSSGTYQWIASYAGDTNNNPVAGICGATGEATTIRQFSPEITTSLSSGQANAPKITVLFGASVTDQATLTGASATAGGSVTYTVYSNDTCTTVFASAGTKGVVNGVVGVSDAVSFPSAGTFYWKASYTGDTNNAPAVSACTDEVLTVTTPDLNTVKLVATNDGAFGPNSNAVPGDTLHFKITVSNTGTAVATNVPVSDNINALLARGDYNDDCSNSCGFAGGILTWTIPTIAANGGSVVLTFSVDLDEAFPEGTTVLPNVVVVTGPGSNCPAGEGNADCDTTTSVSEWQLEIAKTNNAPLEQLVLPDDSVANLPTADEGDTVTYTLSYTVGQLDVTGATIADVLPAGLQYVEGSATGNTQFTFTGYNALTRTLSWTATTISDNGSVTYRALVLAGANELSQPLTNVATIDSSQTSPDEASSDVFVPVPPLAETNIPTPPRTDVLTESNGSSTPGSSLMLILAVLGLLVLGIGFVTPVPAAVRRRNQR